MDQKVIFLCFFLWGCDQVKTKLGLYKIPPDAFTVCPRSYDLEVPSHRQIEKKDSSSDITSEERALLDQILLP